MAILSHPQGKPGQRAVHLSLAFILFASCLLLGSCNTKEKELQAQLNAKNERIEQLEMQIRERDEQIRELRNYVSELANRLDYASSQADRAQQHLQDAEFWARSGNEFLSNSSYNDAKRDIGNMR